jgi:hypothetical protein
LMHAILAAANEYANGGMRAEPIVRGHFTSGNAGRYGWQGLSPKYKQWKEGSKQVVKKRKAAIKASGRVVPKGAALPVLVLTGALRDAITAGRAEIKVAGPGLVMIRWRGLPKYARFHHEGGGNLPKRSPINPSPADQRQIVMAARRYLSAALKTGNAGVGGIDAGRARIG